jgi:hypothetical protein
MLSREERLEQEVAEKRQYLDEYAAEKKELLERLELIQATIAVPLLGEQEDVAAFGRGAWVYCRQHVKPHPTGWCGVSPRDKIGLGVKTAQDALEKCREWGFDIYDPNKK